MEEAIDLAWGMQVPCRESCRCKVGMTLTNEFGTERHRTLQFYLADNGWMFAEFEAPSDMKGTFAAVRRSGKQQVAVYIRSALTNTTRRLDYKERRQWFFGGDLRYEEITGLNPDEWSHEMLQDVPGLKKGCMLVESRPKDGKRALYSRIRTVVCRNKGMRLEFFYKKDWRRLDRVIEFGPESIKGVAFGRIAIHNVERRHSTTLTLERIDMCGKVDHVLLDRMLDVKAFHQVR